MKKIKKMLKALWMGRHSLISALSYILVVGWYGYTLRIIASSDINIFFRIIMFAGGLALTVFTCISLYNVFSKDEE